MKVEPKKNQLALKLSKLKRKEKLKWPLGKTFKNYRNWKEKTKLKWPLGKTIRKDPKNHWNISKLWECIYTMHIHKWGLLDKGWKKKEAKSNGMPKTLIPFEWMHKPTSGENPKNNK
jgi:hypothetical protein